MSTKRNGVVNMVWLWIMDYGLWVMGYGTINVYYLRMYIYTFYTDARIR